MSQQPLLPAQANLKLALWNVEAESVTSSELYIRIQELGLPEEIVSRLHELISFTKKVAGKVFAVGKIVLLKILEFIKAHPFLAVGAGIGFVIGSVVASLIISIPFLGAVLAPIATTLGITITAYGAVLGHRLDKKNPGVGENVFEIAQAFFGLFVDVFNTVFRHTITA